MKIRDLPGATERAGISDIVYVICDRCNDYPWFHVEGKCLHSPFSYKPSERGIRVRVQYISPVAGSDARIEARVNYVCVQEYVRGGNWFRQWETTNRMDWPRSVITMDSNTWIDFKESFLWIYLAIVKDWI